MELGAAVIKREDHTFGEAQDGISIANYYDSRIKTGDLTHKLPYFQ
jgi:hypothetical protein